MAFFFDIATISDPTKTDLVEWNHPQTLCPEAILIVAMAWTEGGGIKAVHVGEIVGETEVTEELIVRKFWHMYSHDTAVGYGSSIFDIPVLLNRAAYYDMPVSFNPYAKPWERSDIDIMAMRYQRTGPKPLSELGKLLTTIPVPAYTPEDVESLWPDYPHFVKSIVGYNVAVTEALYNLWRGYFV